MKKIAAIALVFALLLTGCAADDPALPTGGDIPEDGASTTATTPDGEQVFSLAYYPDRSMNPYHCTDVTNRALFSLIYQGLFTVDRNYEVYPILCQSYNVSADMRTWTFDIAAAAFSDGTAVTASDVCASLLNAKGSAWYAGRLQHVSTITVMGNSVVLQTDVPFENLPILLDIPIVKATEVNAASPVGSGPYRIDGGQLRRQAGWWCDAQLSLTAQTIPLTVAESAKQIRNGFEASDVDLVCADPGAEDYVDFRRDYELWDCENGLFMYLICHEKSKIFENEALRVALTHAIDRDALVSEYYHSFARSATLPASPSSPYYDTRLAENFGYDPQKFADAVAAAQLQSNEVTLLVSTADRPRRLAAQSIADMLGQCGLSVTVKTVSPTKLIEELRWGEYDLFLGQTRLSANMDLSAFFSESGTLSYGGLSDPAIYHLCVESLANAGNYYSLHKLVMESGALCPILFQSYAVYGQRGAVAELSPARDALFFYDIGRTMEDANISGQ